MISRPGHGVRVNDTYPAQVEALQTLLDAEAAGVVDLVPKMRKEARRRSRRPRTVPSTPPDGEPAPAGGALPPSAARGAAERAFGVYVHVPFCRVRCGYCDFNTYTSSELGGGADQASYAATATRRAGSRGRGPGRRRAAGATGVHGVLRRRDADAAARPPTSPVCSAPSATGSGSRPARR